MPGAMGSFKELVESSSKTGLFVDKTLLIKELIDNIDPILVTRPRRWGKTINMNMLFYYFVNREQLKKSGQSDAYIAECDNLFENLNVFNKTLNPDVENTRKFMGKYPAIFISFAIFIDDSSDDDITKPDWNKLKDAIIGRIEGLFAEFAYLGKYLKEAVDEKLHDVEEKFNQIFNQELAKRIAEYKKQFSVEIIPEIAAGEIYKQATEALPHNLNSEYLECPEYQELQKFTRLSRGIPKNNEELSDSINFLARTLNKCHKMPVCVFIDEYDSLINKYFNHENILERLTSTFAGIFSAFAKPNRSINSHIHKVVFTGILRIAKANIFSGLNNLKECTVLDDTFSKYYGFTQTELDILIDKAGETNRKEEVMNWYNGYKMGGETIYNPWSVMQFISTKKLLPHWVDTAHPGIIRDIVLNNNGHAINKILRDIIQNGSKKTTLVDVKKMFLWKI